MDAAELIPLTRRPAPSASPSFPGQSVTNRRTSLDRSYLGSRRTVVVPTIARATHHNPQDFQPLLSRSSDTVPRGGGGGSARARTTGQGPVTRYSSIRFPATASNGSRPASLARDDAGVLPRTATAEEPTASVFDQLLVEARHVQATSAQHHTTRPIHNTNPALDLGRGRWWGQGRGCCCLQCVRTAQVGIVETCGQFERLANPGCHCFLWPITSIKGRLTLRIVQADVHCETKTKDNVFVAITVSVLFRVMPEMAFEAYYRLADPKRQVRSYVFDAVRSIVPTMTIDELFTSQSDIALDIQRSLQIVMTRHYGYEIVTTLVTDLSPDGLVKASMNEINASKRFKNAMQHRAEAAKVETVKGAEAAAERSYLEGLGLARGRAAIAAGMKDTVAESAELISPKDVMDVVLLSQYMDILVAMGGNHMILNADAAAIQDLTSQVSSLFGAPAENVTNRGMGGIIDLLW